MKLLLEEKFSKAYRDEVNNIIEWHWADKGNMTVEEYKNEMLIFKSLVLEQKALKVLVDTRTFALVIIPELQEWIDNNVSMEINKIVQKLAFVLPTDIFTQISIQQTIQEEEGQKYNSISYFDTIEEAKSWLI